jgi:hypothetical protein
LSQANATVTLKKIYKPLFQADHNQPEARQGENFSWRTTQDSGENYRGISGQNWEPISTADQLKESLTLMDKRKSRSRDRLRDFSQMI